MDSGTLPEVPTRFFELDLVIESDIGNSQVLFNHILHEDVDH